MYLSNCAILFYRKYILTRATPESVWRDSIKWYRQTRNSFDVGQYFVYDFIEKRVTLLLGQYRWLPANPPAWCENNNVDNGDGNDEDVDNDTETAPKRILINHNSVVLCCLFGLFSVLSTWLNQITKSTNKTFPALKILSKCRNLSNTTQLFQMVYFNLYSIVVFFLCIALV